MRAVPAPCRPVPPLVSALLACALGACAPASAPDGEGGSDAGQGDSVVRVDAGQPDAGQGGPDGGTVQPDAGDPPPPPPQGPAPGFGVLSGDCRVLDSELEDNQSYFFAGAIDFGADPFDDPDDVMLLSPGGQEILQEGNLGGSSLESEVFAFEVLTRCESAELLKTESEVEYSNPMGKKTDLLVRIGAYKIGVSVTRAIAYPFEDPYTVEKATDLLTQKLEAVAQSSANVAPADAWQKQILSVIAYAPGHAESLRSAWDMLDPATKGDTIIYVTVSNGDDAFLY